MRSVHRPSRKWKNAGTIYVLHFDPAYKHARHYVGFTTTDVWSRFKYHALGRGSPLVRAAVKANCRVEIARLVFPATRDEERRIKTTHQRPLYCSICTPHPRPIRTTDTVELAF